MQLSHLVSYRFIHYASNPPFAGLKIPFSVIIAVINSLGVTSKAGLNIFTSFGAIRCIYHISVTSAGSRSSITMDIPSGHF